jgi:hypothetical protein
VWRDNDCTDDGVGMVAALIEGRECEYNMLANLLLLRQLPASVGQLEHIARGFTYANSVV